eukprot:4339072-Prymnesium_polylepis.1
MMPEGDPHGAHEAPSAPQPERFRCVARRAFALRSRGGFPGVWCGHRMGWHSRYGPPFVCALCALIARCVCAPHRL